MSDNFCNCDLDPHDIWNQKTVKARKEHRCNECRETIEVGEEYERISYLYEGTWGKEKLCMYCNHDWKILRALGMCPESGELESAWKEAYGK